MAKYENISMEIQKLHVQVELDWHTYIYEWWNIKDQLLAEYLGYEVI